MSQPSPERIADTEVESSRRVHVDALLRANAALQEELDELRASHAEVSRRLAAAVVGSVADRQSRRAALNLMEDAIKARVAERHEGDERRRVEEELRDADRRKNEFLATLAHELRGPLAPVRNGLYALRRGLSDPSAVNRLHEMMERQVDHMVHLVDDLMEVSRISGGRVELRKSRVGLAAIVRTAVETSQPLIDAAKHTLEVSLPEAPITLYADPVRIAQVLSNLLSNAAKYTSEGGHIWLSASVEGTNAVIRVRDTGAGIPTAMLPKIFDLFTQVDRTYDRAQGGLGIGLTLVRSLVELHGGAVEARCEAVDHGSEFIVTLPLATAEVAVDDHDRRSDLPPPMRVVRAGSKTPLSRRVLVVDDNYDSAETLGMLLETLGQDVRTVNDGSAALETIGTYKPDVVLLDIGMPLMDGYEVARRIRALPGGARVTLVALTGWGQSADRRKSREAGLDYHLVKPVGLDALEALFPH